VNSKIELLKKQYDFVKDSRKVLFEYCLTISGNDFIQENSTFGRGSIRNLLVHIANTYESWIGIRGLQKTISFTQYDSIKTIEEVISLFDKVDPLMMEFLNNVSEYNREKIDVEFRGENQSVDPLKLCIHVMTHEFHHKGQIMSLSRHLGYTPVDTDIMR
jgi:uncharacterized damage-inducible protein DinB